MKAGRLLIQGGAAVTGAALLAAAMWLYDVKPQVEATNMDPIRSTGRIGHVVTTPDFSIEVQRVDAARSLARGILGVGAPVRTGGVFLIVRARVMSQREPLRLQTAELETSGGYSYDHDPRTEVSETDAELQPLVWDKAAFVFELPSQRLAGARLVVGQGGLRPQLSAEAQVDLGITPARAAELARGATEGYDIRAAGS
jgi:hypothetical protein